VIVEDVPRGDKPVNTSLRILYSIGLVLLGLVLLLFPDKGLALGAFLLGLWLLIDGISSLVHFFQSTVTFNESSGKVLLIRSILWIVLGAVFTIRPLGMAKMGLGLVFFLVGLLFLIQAVLLWSVTGEETPVASLLLGLIGILLMLSPLFTALWFIRVLGILILIRGVSGITRFRLL